MSTVTVRPGLELTWLMSSCALEPGLDGLLMFDLSHDGLLDVAHALSDVLGLVQPGMPARLVFLGSTEDEDDLWSSLRLRDVDGVGTLVPETGPLVRTRDEGPLIVAVPDLARLSLPTSRAATIMLDAPTTTLQRHGQAESWPTRTYWVAACTSRHVGRVSPHLLDRFGVRFWAGGLEPKPDLIDRVLLAVAGRARPPLRIPAPPAAWRDALRMIGVGPQVGDAAVAHALALHERAEGMRRPLALLRLARATARLAGSPIVTMDHVEEVAVLTGLVAATLRAGETPPTRPDTPDTAQSAQPASAHVQSHLDHERPEEDDKEVAVAERILLGAPAEVLESLPVTATERRAFPEDVAEPDREAAPLKLPWHSRAGRSTDRGDIVGTTRARDLNDLAWFDTLRHAALYQRFRSGTRPDVTGLQVSAADLRSYRRVPQPEHLLVLVLDHTCRRGWDWLPALAPYLHRTYVSRGAVCLIEVGGAQAASPLRAERTMLRSLLDPRLSAALSRPAGSATPLAHGLELARTSVQHALQHGAATVAGAELVLATDALGNVPLEMSLRDAVSGPITGAGVTDAMEAARALRDVDRLRTVVLEPPGARHPDILLEFVGAISSDHALVAASSR